MSERKNPRGRSAIRLGRPSMASPQVRRRSSASGSSRSRRSRPALPVQVLTRLSRQRKAKVLVRSASEPALWAVSVLPEASVPRGLSPPSLPPPPLARPHTCFDIFAPSSPSALSAFTSALPKSAEEAKVVVSVTVEGSTGPVRAMVKLGASVGEAIAAVVERYGREGRSPRLEPAAAEAFQLHHSHFCLQSLDKNEKIGEVGGRSFYLHRNGGSNGLYLQRHECDGNASAGEITQNHTVHLAPAPTHHHFFIAFIIKKLDKIGRRTRRLWRVVTCITCA